MRTGNFLFVTGVLIIIVEVIGAFVNLIYASSTHQVAIAGSAWISNLASPFFQGGTLMGLGKIIELLCRR
ncbi:hypothetical protein GCM10025857_26220 [Alicyclobacillus contaminans]|uniref:hypothetical protein n=1 Tax=Alicyclobacillus contaminans TaxID=392016 RepID=UPI00047CEA3C|nr:hypothetical protein [Alicyclobacillus contaminans]GMA51265.1 hypothetical protein GCM10025857_26220 [Alicyclobacillus contaminans]